MMSITVLYLLFLKYGFLCFGGGYMLMPFLTADLVNKGVLSAAEFANLVSIAQITPGPIGLNTSTYVGFIQGGFFASLAATLGLVTPALFLVVLAFKMLKKYQSSIGIQGFLTGMRPASIGLTSAALLIFTGMSVFTGALPLGDWLCGTFTGVSVRYWSLPIIAAAAVLLTRTKLPFPWVLIMCGAAGAFLLR